MRSNPSTILFDLGGTLWHPVPEFEREQALTAGGDTVNRCLRVWGYHPIPDPMQLAREIEVASRGAEEFASRTTRAIPDGRKVFASVLERYGLRLSPEACSYLRTVFSIKMATYRSLLPGVSDTLKALQKSGLRMGVVSDQVWGEGCHIELEQSGLMPFFQAIVLSCFTGWQKPSEHIFRVALSNLEASPGETIMVGDNLRADVQGAQAVGLKSVWMRSPGQQADPSIRPDLIIDQIEELREYLCRKTRKT